MTKETGKVVTVLVVMSLLLGLALVACTPTETVTPPAPPEQPATPPPAETPATPPPAETPATPPPAAKQLSYEAKTYTNSEYGFSVQYPKEWVDQPQLLNKIVVAA